MRWPEVGRLLDRLGLDPAHSGRRRPPSGGELQRIAVVPVTDDADIAERWAHRHEHDGGPLATIRSREGRLGATA